MNSLLKYLVLSIQQATNGFDSIAKGKERRFANSSMYPIFIIGAPRTGSTLLYQLLIKHTRLVFISNLMALLPKKMILIARLTGQQIQQVEDVGESDYGYVPGLFSPNEAGAVMRKWFDQPVTPQEQQLIKNTVVCLSEMFNAPFINKNLLNSLRLQHIYKIFPEARFVYLHRDPLYAAQSIFLARRNALGDEYEWLGPVPFGYEQVQTQPTLYQSLWQVKKIDDAIVDFLNQFNPACITITYETLCQEPGKFLDQIIDEFQLVSKGLDLLPGPLSVRNQVRMSQTEWNQLLQYHAVLYNNQLK
jgi:LPS sulfotransferase NodH